MHNKENLADLVPRLLIPEIGVRTQFSLIYLLQYATISQMEVTNVAQTKIYLTWNCATCYTTGNNREPYFFTPNRIISDTCMS
jgi:hypothetical protein